MQRFSKGQLAHHALIAGAFAAGVTIFGIATAVLNWWVVPVAWVLAAGYVVLRMRRFLRRLRAGEEPEPAIREVLERRVDFYRQLDEAGQARFRREVHWFLLDQHIEGVDVELDDELRALTAAGAVILTFGIPEYEWDTTRDILIYPTRYDEEYQYGPQGDVLGQVSRQGSIILAADALRRGFADGTDGHNVALHEYAHVLDFADGEIDGVPASLSWDSLQPWTDQMHAHLRKIDTGGRCGQVFRDYAYTNEAEFFAVATEVFFEQPGRLQHCAPDLYQLLADFYRQDPLARASAEPRGAAR